MVIKMIQVLICDDDENMVELLSDQLHTILNSSIQFTCHKFTNPDKVMALMDKIHIDLLLIDTIISSISGFELVKEIRKQNEQLLVIFISNRDMDVYESLKYQPFRFIRKSHLEELKEAVASAASKLNGKMGTFVIPVNPVTNKKVNIEDIIYFESMHNNVKVILAEEYYIYRSTLKIIEKQLEGKGFFRIHSGFLVNLKYIYMIKGTAVEISIKNEIVALPLSRSRRNNLISEYKRNL